MFSGLKVKKFDMKKLGKRTLEIHTFKEDEHILVVGKDVTTGELFVLHEEWEMHPVDSAK